MPKRPQSFLVLEYRDLPLLSMPAGRPEMIPHALRCLAPFSLRRRLYRGAVLAAARSLGPRFVLSETSSALPFVEGFPFNSFLQQIRTEIDGAGLFPVLTFPSDLERRRFYVSLLAPDGKARFFVKAVFEDAEASPWHGELEARRLLPAGGDQPFRLPHLHATGCARRAHFIVMEALPRGAHALRGRSRSLLQSFIASISRGHRREVEIGQLPWWREFLANSGRAVALRTELTRQARTPVEVVPAHGDFQRPSIYVEGGVHWLVDWEDYTEYAPPLLDELRFFLGDNTRTLARRPARVLARTAKRFAADTDDDRRLEMALALAYLCSRKNDAGRLCGAEWTLPGSQGPP